MRCYIGAVLAYRARANFKCAVKIPPNLRIGDSGGSAKFEILNSDCRSCQLGVRLDNSNIKCLNPVRVLIRIRGCPHSTDELQ